MKISTAIREYLICPHCHAGLHSRGESFVCKGCGNDYPVVAGVPILIDETASSFRISNYERPELLTRSERIKRAARTVLPKLSLNVAARSNYRNFRELLFAISPNPRVLIIGGATAGAGTEELLADERIDFVSTDAAIDDHTALVCDAQVLPFADQTFDGVIFQAVMFYLPEYRRCIDEMLRVLKPQGVVYSETAFMEQVVGGEYDFYRFTLLGHEYQFRQFEKISSGVSGGPAMATAWSIQYLLLSFTENPYLRAGIRVLCKCTLFWMKYFDLLLVHKRGAVDAAAGTYFMGRRPAEIAPGCTPPSHQTFDEAYQGLIQSDVRAHR
jgi:SAM-dependent methyltransferase